MKRSVWQHITYPIPLMHYKLLCNQPNKRTESKNFKKTWRGPIRISGSTMLSLHSEEAMGIQQVATHSFNLHRAEAQDDQWRCTLTQILVLLAKNACHLPRTASFLFLPASGCG